MNALKRWTPLVSGFVLALKALLTALGYGDLATLIDENWENVVPAVGVLAGVALKMAAIVRKGKR